MIGSHKHFREDRGSVMTEFVMVSFILAMGMLFLIGMGFTLMTKQNAIVGARAAVYVRAWDQPPQVTNLNERIKNAVSPGREEWQVIALRESLQPHPEVEGIGTSNPDLEVDDQDGLLQRAINSIYQMINQEIGYEVNTSPTLGYLPTALKMDTYGLRARSRYYLPHQTWTCRQSGGASYFGIGVNAGLTKLGVEVAKLPDFAKKLLDPGCCDSYEESYGIGP